jgi:hypothetical protein
MSSVSEDKIEVIKVDMSRDDLTAACIAYARDAVKNNSRFSAIDDTWTPQVADNGYGGRTVLFRKKIEQRSGSAQLTGGAQQDIVAQVGR